MAIDQGALEGGMRLAQVRRTKKYLVIAQVMIAVVAVVLLIVLGGNMQLKPFFFDAGVFLYFLILMALIIVVEGLIFRLLEVRYAKTDSAKYYMLKTTARRGLMVIAASAIALLLVLTPYMLDTITDATSEEGTTSSVAPFYSRDALGLTAVDRITVKSDGPTEVLVISENNYRANVGDEAMLRQFAEVYTTDASAGVALTFPVVPFGQYYIVADGEVSYTLHRSLSPFFVGFVTLFATLFIGFNAAWIIYTIPLQKRFVKGAIYR